MNGILELISILSMLAAIGALFWAGFGVLSVSEVGNGSLNTWEATRGPVAVAAAALGVNLVSSFLRRRL